MRICRYFACLFLLGLMSWSAAVPANAAKRVALVIGNSAYEHAAVLDNPINDANDVAAALQKQKFEVIKGIDLDHAAMLSTIRKFSRALSKGDIGVFFYAGHGIQIKGKNYLVPTNAKLADSFGIDFELVRLERIHRAMEQSAKVNIIFLDACRNNPIARNLARSMGTRSAAVGDGLAAMESGIGSLISFSTQPGNVALDGRGSRNSPYAASLAKHISEGEGDITEILIKVRRDVMSATAQKQVPWEHSALTQQFYFSPPKKNEPAAAAAKSSGGNAISFSQQAELAFWHSVKDSNDPALLKSYLDQYPRGAFAPIARLLVARHSAKTPAAGQPAAAKVATETANKPTQVASAKPVTATGAAPGKLDTTAVRGARTDSPEISSKAPKPEPVKTAAVEPAKTAAAASTSGETLTAEQRAASYRTIQRQLKDLNCYSGRIDGQWGRGSQAALSRAYANGAPPDYDAMKSLSGDKSQSVLEALQSLKSGHCKQRATASTERPTPRKARASVTRPKKSTRRKTTSTKRAARRKVTKRKKKCRTVFDPDIATKAASAPRVITVCD